MSNILNTYLKIQKCTFSEHQNSLKDANTIYFIIDTLQVFIGEKEYFQSATIEQFKETLKTYTITEEQFNEDYRQKLSNININSVITTENLEWIDKPEPQDKDYVVITHKYSNTDRVQLAITIDDTNHNSIIYSRVIYVKDEVEVISNWSNEYLMWKDQLNEIQNDINNIENDISSIEDNITQLQKESFNYVGWVRKENSTYTVSTLPENSIAYVESEADQAPFDGASAVITAKYTNNWKMQFAISTSSTAIKTRIVKISDTSKVYYNGEVTASSSNNYGWIDSINNNIDTDKINIVDKIDNPNINKKEDITDVDTHKNSALLFKGATSLTGALNALGMETGTFGGKSKAWGGSPSNGLIYGTYQILGDYCTISAAVDTPSGNTETVVVYSLPIPVVRSSVGGRTVGDGGSATYILQDSHSVSSTYKKSYLVSTGAYGNTGVVLINCREGQKMNSEIVKFTVTYKCR